MKKSISLFIAILIVINIFTGIPFPIIAYAEELTGEDNNEALQKNSLVSLSSEVADVQEEVESIINNYENIAEDFDENVYTAEYISNGEINQLLNYYMNKENPSRQMIDYLNGKPFYIAMREVWEDANFYTDPVGTTFDKLYKTSYYTALLLKLVEATYEDDSFASIVDRKAIKSALGYRKQFIDSADRSLETSIFYNTFICWRQE